MRKHRNAPHIKERVKKKCIKAIVHFYAHCCRRAKLQYPCNVCRMQIFCFHLSVESSTAQARRWANLRCTGCKVSSCIIKQIVRVTVSLTGTKRIFFFFSKWCDFNLKNINPHLRKALQKLRLLTRVR